MASDFNNNAGSVGDMTCSCQGDNSCEYLYSVQVRDNALSIDDGLSFCCNGANECNDSSGTFTLPATCAAGDYTDSAASSCSVPTSSPSQSPSKAPTGSPSKVVSVVWTYLVTVFLKKDTVHN